MNKFAVTCVLLSLILLISCSTISVEIPSWVNSPEKNINGYSTFVAVGLNNRINEAETSKFAKKNALEKIEEHIDLKIDTETPLKVVKAYNDLIRNLEKMLSKKTYKADDNIKILKTFVSNNNRKQEVFLLVEYNSEYLSKEKQKINSLLRTEQAYRKNIEGDEFFDNGYYYKAATKYIEALILFSDSDDYEKVKLDANLCIKKSIDSINKIKINNISGPTKIYLGEDYTESIVAIVSADQKSLIDVPIDISYEYLYKDGKKSKKTVTKKTDLNGHVTIKPEVPKEIGKIKINYKLSITPKLYKDDFTNSNLGKQIDLLSETVLGCTEVFEFDVSSRAVDISTCVVIMDVDKTGNLLEKTATASAVINELKANDFNIELIPIDFRMTTLSNLPMIDLIKKQYKDKYDRIIYGSAKILSFEENENSVSLKVEGEIKAVDINSGKVLFSSKEQKRVSGTNNKTIITAAFKSLGRYFGEQIIRFLQ